MSCQGHVTWGRERSLDTDLDGLADMPDNRWLGPQKYDYLLDRAGVSKALRGVLSLPQGETDRLMTETRSGLMRRLLELTGRQSTLDEFRVARAKYGEARTLHREARQHFEQKKLGLDQLQSKLRQYREWEALREKLQTSVASSFPRPATSPPQRNLKQPQGTSRRSRKRSPR